MGIETRRLGRADARDMAWIARESEPIGGPVIVSGGRLHDLWTHPAVVAYRDGSPIGFAVYRIDGATLEILAIRAVHKHQGVGSLLLAEVERIARSRACTRIWLTTTNDNLEALRFYQRRGFAVCAYRVGGFREVLRLKGYDPNLRLEGKDGIPLKDLIELSRPLTG